MSHDLTIERVIDAPVAAVWRAWSEQGEEWLCPKPWRAEILVQDLRAGGRSEMVFRGPGGEEQPLSGIYLAVEPERLVVATDAVDGELAAAGAVHGAARSLRGSGRRPHPADTATARHWTAEACEQHRAMGFEAGWGASADQLAGGGEAAGGLTLTHTIRHHSSPRPPCRGPAVPQPSGLWMRGTVDAGTTRMTSASTASLHLPPIRPKAPDVTPSRSYP
ncbi:SRPBCC domain-containing protein [Sphingomonas sp. MMS24-JH45]